METQNRIDSELRRCFFSALHQHADPEWADDLCNCIDPVLALLHDHHDAPVSRNEPAIHRIISDRCLTGAGGAMHFEHAESIDRHVRLFIRELNKLMHVQLKRGEWSDAPVPPQMFG